MFPVPKAATWLVGALALGAIVVASLIPADMQIRLGLHWLVEHFFIFAAATAMLACASRKPLLVGGLMMLVSPLLETLQGLTPDRTPDVQTALSGATGALTGALLVKLVMAVPWRRERREAA